MRFREGVHYEVDEDGCWLWLGSLQHGYGIGFVGRPNRMTASGGRPSGNEYAHRTAWQDANGPIPEGLQIDHLCRVRRCVNPAHLEAVTSGENTRRGNAAKLTWDVVREIRAGSGRVRETARAYGIDHSIVCRIRSFKAWWPEP